MAHNNKVIYTSLTGGYDELPQYEVIHPDFDYICFSNDFPANSRQGIWTIRPIPIKSKSNLLLSRYAKLVPHELLNNYDVSVWLDSNLRINTSEFYTIINNCLKKNGSWFGISHPLRDCIYEEAKLCIIDCKSGIIETKKQIRQLKNEGFPEHYGLFENNVILRWHNHPDVIKIDEEWWQMFNKFTKRDQLSLSYLFWKFNFTPQLLLPEGRNTRNIEAISYFTHTKRPFYQRVFIGVKRNVLKNIINLIF